MDFQHLAAHCAPEVHVDTLRRIVHVESAFNPHAIGVVGARLSRQPINRAEAVRTAKELEAGGYNYSIGLAQINRTNFARYGISQESGFDPCANLRAGARILAECFDRAQRTRDEQQALRAALSCYYSGNFKTGFDEGYVAKVVAAPESVKPTSDARHEQRPAAADAPTAIPIRVVPKLLDKVPRNARQTSSSQARPQQRPAIAPPEPAGPPSALIF